MNQPRSDPVTRMERKNNTAFHGTMFLFLFLIVGLFYAVEYGLPSAQRSAGDNTPGKILLVRFAVYFLLGQ